VTTCMIQGIIERKPTVSFCGVDGGEDDDEDAAHVLTKIDIVTCVSPSPT